METFAKIINHPTTQILLVKDLDEKREESINVTFKSEGGIFNVCMSFDSDEDRDEKYNDTEDSEWIELVSGFLEEFKDSFVPCAEDDRGEDDITEVVFECTEHAD